MRLLLISIFFAAISFNGFAKHIEEFEASIVGKSFLSMHYEGIEPKDVALDLVYTEFASTAQNASVYFYIFNSSSNGFVIVAGDDEVLPILAYSLEGNFSPESIPNNTKKWLENYKQQIDYILINGIQADADIQQQWIKLLSNKPIQVIEKASVQPLVQTKWNQSPYYNASCPTNTVTGCVATAMAQIMKYWNYPVTGSGFHSYNHPSFGTLSANFGSTSYQWASMPTMVNSTNNAVATLMYQVGVSVDMTYGTASSGGSSAYVISAQSPIQHCSEYALKTYFGYKPTLQGIQRANYSESQWLTTLKSELDASRPILYAGFGSGGGHCFVADGYDNSNYIHFNWGWGGNSDGYFQINALNPGALGTGGGSGGFNAGHQAVIGIEPPTTTQNYSLALYNYVAPSASVINYGQGFSVSTNIINNGATTYNGDYAMAIFDASYNFIDYVEVLTGYNLPSGYVYNSNLTFTTTGLFSMLPGNYYVGAFYRPTGGNWMQLADNGSYTNLVPMTVVNSNSIELNSAISVTPGTTLTQGQPVSVNLNILNNGSSTFYGDYSVALYNLDGSFAQTIGTVTESNGLPSGYTYLSPYLTFNTSSVTVSPGTYLLAVQHNPNNSGWQLTGSSYYLNPIKVTVIAANLNPDIYEVNNIVGQAYTLPITFSGTSTTKNTVGSNIHIGTDNDFYKIQLPNGYNYTIQPRIHDAYNSGNGNVYTVDALFSYSTDGVNWSQTYDDVMAGSITVANGGTVYYRVAPYFSGDVGSYLLDMNISRVQTGPVGVEEEDLNQSVLIYPNPATGAITIDFRDLDNPIESISMFNVQGQIILKITEINVLDGIIKVPLTNFSEGMYLVKLGTSKGGITKRIVVK